MKYLLRKLKPFRKESILAPAFKMLEAMFDLLVPMVVAYVIDSGVRVQDQPVLYRGFVMLILMAIVGLACSFTAQYFSAKAAIGSTTALRHDLYAHIQTLSFRDQDRIGVSTLMTRLTADILQVQNGVNLFLRLFLRSPFIVFGALIMAFSISSRISLIFLGGIALLFLCVIVIMRITGKGFRDIQKYMDKLTLLSRENLEGVRVIRAFRAEDAEEQSFREQNQDMQKQQFRTGRVSALLGPLTGVTVNLCIILILHLGAGQVNGGILLSGQVVALVNYMNQILVELVKLANLVVTLSKASASMNRVSQILDTRPGMQYPESSSSASTDSDTAVSFDHVSLRYSESGEASLRNLTFQVRRGETLGIIGGTGCGKTSLVSLIPRFYDATEGEVCLGSRNVRSYARGEIIRNVGVVMQRPHLFQGTIRSNLTLGCPDADDTVLWEALEQAQAAEFVREKKGGLDAEVEQEGRNLSGGQKQRLTIARALINKPEVLILDDASSALDYATDAALRRNLSSLSWPCTVILVSQRTATIQQADRILVMDHGQIVGQGTHSALLRDCPLYREIHESQYQEGEAE